MNAPISWIIFVCLVTEASALVCGNFTTWDGLVTLDCSRRGLDRVPSDIVDTVRVTSLDLSGNNLTSLGPRVFRSFYQLYKLNLSDAGISEVHAESLNGLEHLKVLDLTNNPVFATWDKALSDVFFTHTTNISHLYISGSPLHGSVFLPLEQLEELTMTPHSKNMPHDLVKLANLRVLNFAFCRIYGNLTRNMLEPFSHMNLAEMAFHGCDIREVEVGSFDNFKSLRLLNFACNYDGSVDSILEALSASEHLRLESLVLDSVGSEGRSSVVLGIHVNGSCQRVWSRLRNLSIRGTHVIGEQNEDCIHNLETLSLGFNAVLFGPKSLRNMNLKYIDASYYSVTDDSFLQHTTGCFIEDKRIPPNYSYFPERVPRWEQDKCDSDDNSAVAVRSNTDCHVVNFLPCLLYARLDHIAVPGYSKLVQCSQVSKNRLRYLNVSSKTENHHNNALSGYIYGLNELETVDMSNVGLIDINGVLVSGFPALKELYVNRNNLGSGNISHIQHLDNLTLLDLSANQISFLSEDIFSDLPNLQILNLKDNNIKDTNWLQFNLRTLRYLNMRNNKLETINVTNFEKIENVLGTGNLVLDLTGNPLQCGCDQLDFIRWFRTTSVHIEQKTSLICHGQILFGEYINNVDLDKLIHTCSHTTHKISLSVSLCVTSAVLISASILIYKFRWKIKWRYYKARHLSKRNGSDMLLRVMNNDNIFSTFIIYPMNDRDILMWVKNSLLSKIELEWQRQACFMRGRNDIVGYYDIDNIVEGLTHSQTALWVICPEFFEDNWCEMAANFAVNHLGVKNNAFLIMENSFEQYRVPRHFANLLDPKLGTLILRFTDDEDGRTLFWSKLRDFVPFNNDHPQIS